MNELFQRAYDWYLTGPREFCRELMCEKGFDSMTDERVEAAEERQRLRMRDKYDLVVMAYLK